MFLRRKFSYSQTTPAKFVEFEHAYYRHCVRVHRRLTRQIRWVWACVLRTLSRRDCKVWMPNCSSSRRTPICLWPKQENCLHSSKPIGCLASFSKERLNSKILTWGSYKRGCRVSFNWNKSEHALIMAEQWPDHLSLGQKKEVTKLRERRINNSRETKWRQMNAGYDKNTEIRCVCSLDGFAQRM